MTAYDTVCERLRATTGHDGRNGQWRCPAHDDRSPSLSVDLSDSGVLLHCHAGCPTERVVDALNLRMSDLFDEQPERPFNGQPQVKAYRPNGNSSNGASTEQNCSVETVYNYVDEHGELLFQVVRGRAADGRKTFRQRRPDGHGGWTWNTRGVRKPLYRLPEMAKAIRDGQPVVVVEGEKDVETVEQAGGTATCNPGGAGKWLPEHTQVFAGYGGPIIVVADHDRPGYLHAAHVYDQLAAAGCTRLFLVRPGGGHKDISDQLAAGHRLDDWADLDDWDQIVGATDEADTADNSGTRLPDGFWTSRPELEHVRQAAIARRCAPTALLLTVLSRASSYVPHRLTVGGQTGNPLPLGTFTVLYATTGGGKSRTIATARNLIAAPDWITLHEVPLGSGEGLAEMMFEQVTELDDNGNKTKVRRQTRHNAWAVKPEGQELLAQSRRQGATILPTLRSAWSGETLGQQNAREETRRPIPAGSYTIGVTVGFQPSTVDGLLADDIAGTPGRFVWAHTHDPDAPDQRNEWPGQLDWAPPPDIADGWDIPLAAEVAIQVEAEDLAQLRGELVLSPVEAQGRALRLKLAGMFAVLAGRWQTGVTVEDWQLATTVAAVSDEVRHQAAADVAHRAALANEAKRQGHIALQADAASAVDRRRVEDGARRIANKVHAEPDRWTVLALKRDLRRWRDVYDDSLDHAATEQWIVETEEPSHTDQPTRRLRPGPNRP